MAIGNRKMPEVVTQQNLAEIYGMLGELNTAIRSKNNPATRKEVETELKLLSGLVGTCKQLGNDAKDPNYFKSRMGACKEFYESYNKLVKDYKEKLEHVEVAEGPSSPDKVTVNGDQGKFKKQCGLAADFDDLIVEMKKPANYAPTSVAGQFTPRFNKHEAHVTGGGNEWKAYVEKGTKNTKWRLYFTTKYHEQDHSLEIKLTKCQQDH
ncbi:MAG TPA: hypothetical protein VHQ47_05550 [Phycisphaerae bacterium]|nr:hypothetical protein [Phycisphaerae bacterium]